MKFLFLNLLSLALILVSACSTGQNRNSATRIPAPEFREKLNQNRNAVLLDVRTPEEFAGGYIPGAKNIDWNGSSFESQAASLDKTKPVFVYCLVGGRSASAAQALRSMGFSSVIELDGGILQWRAAGFPEAGVKAKAKGMTRQDLEAKLSDDKVVLVDFYAEWCGPCKKMKPDMEQLENEFKDKMVLIRIDADAHPNLANEMGVNVLPTLVVFRNRKETIRSEGFQTKQQMATLMGL